MNINTHDHSLENYSKTVFGFWIYLLTDFVLFATILSVYFVLRNSTFGGPSAQDLLPLSYTFIQTIVLLTCSLTSGLAGVAAHRKNKNATLALFGATFLIGFIFMWMEFSGFHFLIENGNGWQRSGFLSAYFTLLGTHALHVVFALLWILVLLPPVWRNGITTNSLQRLTCLRMFWQFLSVIWIGVYTMVYLMGVS